MTENIDQQKIWMRIVGKAWSDEVYKQRLLDNPADVLAQEGMAVPEGVELEVIPQRKGKAYFMLPEQPENTDITEVEERLAAQHCFSTSPWICGGSSWP